MIDPIASPDLLDIVPDPIEIRRRLGATYRTADILRRLLRLAERRRDHDRLSVPVPPEANREAVSHAK